MFTKNGTVKKTALTAYSNPRGKGIIAISLEDKDELIAVRRTIGKQRPDHRNTERPVHKIQ